MPTPTLKDSVMGTKPFSMAWPNHKCMTPAAMASKKAMVP